MKSPSQNVSASLRGQRVRGRGPETVEVTGMKPGGPSMTVPGEGSVARPPGPEHERSSAVYTEPMGRFGGSGR